MCCNDTQTYRKGEKKMQTTHIQQETKSNRHHKDGSYFLTEFRTSTGRLILAEGRTAEESRSGVITMLNKHVLRMTA